MKNKIAVYTAIFGDYDSLKPQSEKIKGCDFICFTDNKNLHSDFWRIVRQDCEFDDPTRDARKRKILSHDYLPEHEYSLWVDGSTMLKEIDVEKMFKELLKDHDLAISKHSSRDCVYDEILACVKLKKDDPMIMAKQIIKYIQEDYPKKNGLAETNAVLRRHTDDTKRLNEAWWKELCKYSRRDQLSIDYVSWKTGVSYYPIPESSQDGRYFKRLEHKKNNFPQPQTNCDYCAKNRAKVEKFERSKFWKMRGFYMKIKNLIFGR